MADLDRKLPTPSIGGLAGTLFLAPWTLLMRLLEPPMAGLQRLLGLKGMPYLFLIPNLLFFGTFVFVPLIINFGFSVTGGSQLFLSQRPYVGDAHYAYLFDCGDYLDVSSCRADTFWRGVYNTALFVVLQVGFLVGFSLVTALVLNKAIPFRGFFRSVFFYPVLLSPVVVALIWKWILQRDGLLNAIITGFGGERILFFIDPDWAMFWSVFVSIWAHLGFYTLILLAGLQAIPKDLYEAADMDGTSRPRVLWRITLPLLWPNMIVVIVLALIRAVQIFDEVFVLTGGGPGTATQFLVQYIYSNGFASSVQNFGLAAAASVLLGSVLLVLTLLQLYAAQRREARK
ncbi:MAG: carbohydrate ABC transporter permease [Alphaproteobacteria bacterium]